MLPRKNAPKKPSKGFTLVELIVVVTIVALLASIAIPAFVQSRQDSVAARTANDFRQFAEKFELHNLSTGEWPADGVPTSIPAGMEEELDDGDWGSTTAVGGNWDWDFGVFGVTAAVSIDNPTANEDTLLAVDKLLDDGNLNSGILQLISGSHLSYIVVE